MTLLNTAAGVGNTSQDTTEAENIYAANAALAKPKKVSSRPVEPVPFNADKMQSQVDFAKGNAATGSVSNDSLVQNQLNKVLATDGPLLKRARTDGFASAAERGLNNSSMGVQAGEEAVIRQALQIATPDAQTYGEMDRANLSSAAGMAQMGVNQAFSDYNNDKNYNFTAGENALGREQQLVLQKGDQDFTAGENNLNRVQQKDLQLGDQKFQSSESRLARGQQRTLQSKDQAFQSNENLLTREQQLALQKGDQSFQSGENLLSRAQQLELQKGDQAFQSGENTLSREQQLALQKGDQSFQAGQQEKQNQFSSGENKSERDFRAAEQDKLNEFNVQRDAKNQDYNLESIKAQTTGQIEVAASQLDERSRGAYLESASNLQRSYIDQQTAILNNPALKKDVQVTNALNVAKQNFESSVSYLQGLYAQGGVRVNASAFPSVGPVQFTPPPSAAVMAGRY